jgi:NAD(P)-dependent dehydrogenase (short-subunit alcohol dehydrogenase family)
VSQYMSDNFDGKVVVVTGAARGLGAEIARGFADQGASVVLVDVDADRLDESVLSLQADARRALGRLCDTTDRAGLMGLAKWVAEEVGPASVVVNNAGITGRACVGDAHAAELWDRTIQVNLTGTYNVSSAFLEQLKTTRGNIVNLSSVAGFTSGFSHAGYPASKAAISSLTRQLARELASFDVRVNAVAPGYFSTDLGKGTSTEVDEWLAWHCPLGRRGAPSEIVGPVLFLASAAASFVTGVTIPVDGGYLSV